MDWMSTTSSNICPVEWACQGRSPCGLKMKTVTGACSMTFAVHSLLPVILPPGFGVGNPFLA